MKRTNTNSALAAITTLVGLVVALAWQSWSGLLLYVAGFLVGGVGTVVNEKRARQVRMNRQ